MKKVLYPGLASEMAKRGDLLETLAKLLDLQIGTVCWKINGKSEWKISEINKLCKHYGKSYEELFKND